MSDILKQLQAYVDHMAETGCGEMPIPFDDLNEGVGEIERLRAERDDYKRCAEAAALFAERAYRDGYKDAQAGLTDRFNEIEKK
jgi:hypothetical protein